MPPRKALSVGGRWKESKQPALSVCIVWAHTVYGILEVSECTLFFFFNFQSAYALCAHIVFAL